MNSLHDPKVMNAVLALSKELHFGRAAATLGIAQPRLSQLIKRAEALAGIALFERTTRSTLLTEAGQALVNGLQRGLAEFDDGLAQAKLLAAGKLRTLNVGYVTVAMLLGLPAAILRFRKTHQGVKLRLHEVSTDAQVDLLLAGKLDLAMLTNPAVNPHFRTLHKLPDRLAVVVPSNRRASGPRRDLEVGELADEPFIFFPRDEASHLYSLIRSLCEEKGLATTPDQEAGSWYSVLSLVSAGMGFTIAPASTQGFNLGSLAYVPIPGTKSEISIQLCVKTSDRSPLPRSFADSFDNRKS